MNEIYCIISQTAGDMSMYPPSMKYLGTDFDQVWSIVCKEMEDFHEFCYNKKEGVYTRPDTDEVFQTWEDLLTSIYDEINNRGKFVLDYNAWECDEPGFFCVYKREE